MSEGDPLKNLTVLKYLGEVEPDGGGDEQSIYQTIGVEPVINCRGTFTIIGGSVERPEVAGRLQRGCTSLCAI